VQCLAVIRKAAKDGTWQAAAWLVERRYPASYGRGSARATEHPAEPSPTTGDDSEPGLADLPTDVLHERIRAARERLQMIRGGRPDVSEAPGAGIPDKDDLP
jgi:hypothetical protein